MENNQNKAGNQPDQTPEAGTDKKETTPPAPITNKPEQPGVQPIEPAANPVFPSKKITDTPETVRNEEEPVAEEKTENEETSNKPL